METLSISFERSLYQAVIRFKQDHTGVLEARTKLRKERCAKDAEGPVQNIQNHDGPQDPDVDDGRRDRRAGTIPHCPGGPSVHHGRADVRPLDQDGVSGWEKK